MTLEEIMSRFPDAIKRGAGFMAKCPAHEDKQASLSIDDGVNGQAVMFCHAGCSYGQIMDALGIKPPQGVKGDRAASGSPEIVKIYPYTDLEGNLLYEAIRYRPKGFRQRKPNGKGGYDWNLNGVRRVLYRLPDVAAAILAERIVCIVEGEKDVENLVKLGFCATTNAAGAGKWEPQYTESLRGAHVVILPDNDDAGEKHLAVVAEALDGVAASVRVLRLPGLPDKGDVTDWLRSQYAEEKTVEEIADNFESLMGASEPYSKKEEPSSWSSLSFLCRAHETILEERVARGDGLAGLSTGLHELDAITSGLKPAEYFVLAARPSMGKTALAATVALNVARQERRVGIFSLEMSENSLTDRFVSAESGVPLSEIIRGDLNERQMRKIRAAYSSLSSLRLAVDDTRGLAVSEVIPRAEALKARLGGLDLLVVDYLQIASGVQGTRYGNRQEVVSSISLALRNAAGHLGIPIITLAQLHRGVESRADKEPEMSDLRESGGIENDADSICLLFRKSYYEPKSEQAQVPGYVDNVKVIVAKQRNGPTGQVFLGFKPHFCEFIDLSQQEPAYP